MAITICPDQEDALLRVATYHRRDFDLVVIRSPLREHAPVLPFIAQPFPTAPTSNPGTLGRLPAELMTAICLFLDIQSCFQFRQVSRWARILVSGLPEYRHVAHHALEALRAVLRTGLAPHFNFGALYRLLCSTECQQCGSFGGFLFLPTAARCCFQCLEHSPQLGLSSLSHVAGASGISPARLCRLVPVLRTISGFYGMQERQKRLHLVPNIVTREALKGLGIAPGKLRAAVPQSVHPAIDVVQRFMAATVFPSLDRASGQVEHGISCKGCQVAVEGDNPEEEAYDRRDLAYSRRGFLGHFQSCAEAQRLWMDSCAGTRAFDEPEFTRRGGFLDEPDSEGHPR